MDTPRTTVTPTHLVYINIPSQGISYENHSRIIYFYGLLYVMWNFYSVCTGCKDTNITLQCPHAPAVPATTARMPQPMRQDLPDAGHRARSPAPTHRFGAD